MSYKVYGRNDCTYCQLTIKLLERKGIPFQYISIKQTLREFLNEFSTVTGNQRTIPLIFNEHNVFIGGYHDLVKILNYNVTDDF